MNQTQLSLETLLTSNFWDAFLLKHGRLGKSPGLLYVPDAERPCWI